MNLPNKTLNHKTNRWPSNLVWRVNSHQRHTLGSTPLRGKAVCILGGGPSLTREQAQALTAASGCIAVNNSYILLSEPSVVLSLDRRWWDWHGAAVRQAGHTSVTGLQAKTQPPVGYEGIVMDRDRMKKVPPNAATLVGQNSGHAAISLAVNLGSQEIYLAGFDMRFAGSKTHWHEGHKVPSSEANYANRFRPALEEAATMLWEKQKVHVSCITPTAAKISITDFETALTRLRTDHANSLDNP